MSKSFWEEVSDKAKEIKEYREKVHCKNCIYDEQCPEKYCKKNLCWSYKRKWWLIWERKD